MSLLIKALETAEKDKQAELNKEQKDGLTSARGGLELEPFTSQVASNTSAESFVNKKEVPVQASFAAAKTGALVNESKQKEAANVFVANQAAKNSSSATTLLLLGVAGALIVWLGLQGYQYFKSLTTAQPVVAMPALRPTIVAEKKMDASQPVAASDIASNELTANASPQKTKQEALPASPFEASSDKAVKAALKNNENALTAEATVDSAIKTKSSKKISDFSEQVAETQEVSSLPREVNQPVKLTSKTPVASVDPILLAAYQAFTRGDDAAAQQQYRQVLQRDVRNVDALLGMAAIAQRQARDADAVGWYQKVLEIEPRNTMAQSAVASLQATEAVSANNDLVSKESRIKNMLAQQPEAAHLHAALGNLYAAQNQWHAAQDAYFNASRLAPDSVDYAFNLAVSLEHLGKPSLALTQYQRALVLLNSGGGMNPVRAQLESRIQALQAVQ